MLKRIIEKLDEVPEALRDHYVEKDGKWHLQVEGMKTQEDIDRQQAALQAERTAHKTTKDALKASNDKLEVWGELEPDDVTAKLEKLTTLEGAGNNPKAEEIRSMAETLATARIKTETTKLQRSLDKMTEERDAAVNEGTGLKTQIVQRTVDDAIRGAATGAKVIPEAVPDLTILARNEFKLVDGKVVTEDGRDAVQWLEDRKKTAPYLWPQAKGAGAQGGSENNGGLQAGDNPFSYAGWNVTKQGQAVTADRSKAAKLAEQAGTTIGGPKPPKPV